VARSASAEARRSTSFRPRFAATLVDVPDGGLALLVELEPDPVSGRS